MNSQSFCSYNPANGEKLWEGVSSSWQDVNNAVTSAQTAFTKWSQIPLEKRIKYLESYSNTLTTNQEQMSEAISKETGKTLWDSKGEVSAMINKVKISIDAYHQRCAEIIREQPNATSVTRHKPHGVLAVLGPYNFPGHLPNGHIVPALLAGNTIVFKPSELTPLVGQMMVELWEKSGLPEGVINLVQGGVEAGKFLSKHPDINGLLFTGSWPTGKALAAEFAQTPEKILALEMGGNNPFIVSDVSNIQAAVYLTIQSAYLSSGQRCTCARRLIVPHGKQGDIFIQKLIEAVRSIKVGPYTDTPEPFMGPVISETAANKLLAAQNRLQALGGQPLVLMTQLKTGTAFVSPGLMDVSNINNLPDEEIFGPFLQLKRVANLDAAIEEANRTAFGLSAGLLSDRNEEYELFYKKIRAGVINWNTATTGASSAAPFGGIGHSGNNRPSAFYAADYCAFPVASLESQTLKMPSTLTPGIKIETQVN